MHFIRWWENILIDKNALYHLRSVCPPGANGIFFLSHFNDTTKKEDLIRAVVEGLNYAFLDMLKALELGAGQKAEKITAIGGGTRNEFWMQNKADVSGRPVVTLGIEEATALGAAMLAGVGIGVYKDFAEAVKGVLKQGWLFEPNIKLASFYAELFEIYRDVYPTS